MAWLHVWVYQLVGIRAQDRWLDGYQNLKQWAPVFFVTLCSTFVDSAQVGWETAYIWTESLYLWDACELDVLGWGC